MNDEQMVRPPEIVDPLRPWLLREVDPSRKGNLQRSRLLLGDARA